MSVTIALAGNPNCGKTTMFNALTGANQYVGNWPGVTVEKKEGKMKNQKEEFNMCQALDELMADKMNEGILIGKHEGILIGKHEGILIGKREGKHEGILLEKQNSEAKIRTIISNMLAGGISCENICRFLECDPSLVEQVQAGIQ